MEERTRRQERASRFERISAKKKQCDIAKSADRHQSFRVIRLAVLHLFGSFRIFLRQLSREISAGQRQNMHRLHPAPLLPSSQRSSSSETGSKH
jgi:hypothetical protein